jgi:hypothetical protein
VLIVGIDEAAVEADLIEGRICCPGCKVGLRPWGHGVEREVRLTDTADRRRSRRSICRPWAATHVLGPRRHPSALPLRRRGSPQPKVQPEPYCAVLVAELACLPLKSFW